MWGANVPLSSKRSKTRPVAGRKRSPLFQEEKKAPQRGKKIPRLPAGGFLFHCRSWLEYPLLLRPPERS